MTSAFLRSTTRINVRRRLSDRAALLLGAATLPIVMTSVAQAQTGETVILEEGRTPTPVALGAGDDRLVVDIGRVNGDTGVLDLSGLVTEPLTDAGGRDTVWLRATSTTTHDIVYQNARSNPATRQYVTADGTPFDGGTVYEAAGNGTVLTLENKSRSTRTPPTNDEAGLPFGPLRLAGDGTIVLGFSLHASNQPEGAQQAIYVEAETSTASGDGKLDLEIRDNVGGGRVGDGGLADVSNANSMRLISSQLRYKSGLGIKGGEADVIIEANSWVGADDEAALTTLIESSGRVYNKARMSIGSQFGGGVNGGVGVLLNGGQLYNIFQETLDGTRVASGGLGRIYGGSSAVVAEGDANYIENSGFMNATNGPTILNIDGTLVTRNIIKKFTNGGGSQIGEIEGGTLGAQKVAYQSVGNTATDVVVNSGKITGDILLGSGAGMFLYTEANNGVTGLINGGDGIDGYGKSFSASATHNLANNILDQGNNIGFEMHGIESIGPNTTITVAATETLDAGLMLIGNGTVVNTANITENEFQPGVWARDIEGLSGGLRFVNRGQIDTWGTGFRAEDNVASFTNEGSILSRFDNGVTIDIDTTGAAIETFNFLNTGLVQTADNEAFGVHLRFNARGTNGLLADLINSGSIRHTGAAAEVDGKMFAFLAMDASGRGDLVRLVNSGTIEATAKGTSGANLVGGNLALQNDKSISAAGDAAGAVLLEYARDSIQPRTQALLTNSGTITAAGNTLIDDEINEAVLAYGAAFNLGGSSGGDASLINTGTISTTGTGSVAVAAYGGTTGSTGSTFTLDNRGTIRGVTQTDLGAGVELANLALLGPDQQVLAGAIHTRNTVDEITNRGTIQGGVNLGELSDVLRNYGTLNDNVQLGSGSDTYITGTGATLAGTVDGGASAGDWDVIRVDLTGADAKKLNASQFTNFEALTTVEGSTGTGSVSIFGTIDQAFMRLRAIALHIDAGDTVRSASGATGYTFGNTSENTSETITNNGTIEGGVSMGAGDDTLTNTGTIGFDVDMGSGNDTVTNSGRINGNLNLGTGDDRYIAQSGGLVTGSIDGGEGTDTFVFRLNGNSGSIPSGFTNFESFGAYGPGTLTLALAQDYDTIELFETANLTLTDGPGTVGQIKGDDSAQVVTIEDSDFTGGVSLAGGNDTLSLQLAGALTGALDGGAGTDTLKLNLTAAASINDLFNFEVVDVAGASPLTLTGTLGAGQQINFDGSDNHFIVDTGATFAGTANGGAGTDTLEINTGAANSRTIVAGQLLSFEKLVAGGAGTLALNGQSYAFDSVEVAGNLSIGNGASLASASGVHFGDSDNRLTLEGTGAVTSPVDGGDGTDTIAFDLAAGQTRNLSSAGTLTSFEVLAASGAGTLNVDQNATYQRVSIEGGHLNVLGGATLTAPVNGGATADRLTVNSGGAVRGNVNLGDGDDVVTNAGTITGDVNLGAGNDRYVAQAGGVVTGTIDGGAGNNTFVFRLEGSQGNLPGSVLNFSSFGAYGPGTLTVNLDAGQTYQNLELLEGANLVLSGTNGAVANVIGDDSAQSVTIDGVLTGGVSLGGGNDSLTMQLSGLLQGALDGGAGTDTLNLTLTGAASIGGMFGFETANITGASPLTLTGDFGANQRINFNGNTDNELIVGAGATFAGTVDGGAGHDTLRVQSGTAQTRTVVASQILSFEDLISEGAGTLVLSGGTYSFDNIAVNGGNLELGTDTKLGTAHGIVFDGADNRFTVGLGAEVSGTIEGGAGNDTLALVQGPQWARLLSLVQATGFERLEASGNGVLRIDRNASFVNGVGLDGGTTRVDAGSTLTADVTGGTGAETFVVAGALVGAVDLGAGNDTLRIEGAGTISGARNGGDGIDRLSFSTNGTYAAPTVYDGTGYSGFELFEVAGGVVSVTGTSSWTGVSITGGRLIGQAGSVISSSSAIEVGQGATFGSAGTVNANINVAGTLSPGASPGTMTVNGNVAFAAGSNLLLEVSPTVSDLLNISGTLTIANGTTMDITGVLNGTPGNRLDLVVAQGGITGRFTTINKSNTIFGFVVQNGNRLQIQSEFLNGDYQTNTSASIGYANEVLRDGYGVQAFTAALPVLVDAQGVVNQRAFAQLTPEAYGSAIQLAEENSLLIVDGVHSATAIKTGSEGLYSFGQFLAGSADIEANGISGAGASHLTNRGFFGGVGYGFGSDAQIGAFVGGLDGKQTVRWLGAQTERDALAGGVFADAALGGLGLHGLVAVNAGKAETKRNLMVLDGTGKAKYDLTSWVADLGVDYQVKFGPWAITPKLGVTYVHTSRGASTEQGLGDFSLMVDQGSKSSWYGEAAVTASGSFDLGGAKVSPYAQIGVRQLLSDARVLVSGRYAGADTGVIVDGVEREKTAMRVALGLGVDVTEGVRLQAGYTGEFAGTKRDSVMGGFTLRF